jgi:hypothetical protein
MAHRARLFVCITFVALVAVPAPVWAQSLEKRVIALEFQVRQLQQAVTQLRTRVSVLQELASNSVLALNHHLTLETVHGHPTARFTGVNVQIVNGLGQTYNLTPNGVGNLIVGYDETGFGIVNAGSHNLVVGDFHTYDSTGGVVFGVSNHITGLGAVVSGGDNNTASGADASVSGGHTNAAGGDYSSVSGGFTNTAACSLNCKEFSGRFASVSGGSNNVASGEASSVGGGQQNFALGDFQFLP